MSARDRYEELKNIILDITGLTDQSLKTRVAPNPTVRTLIWIQMREEGYRSKEIAAACGRDYSTVIYMTNSVQDILKQDNPSWRSITRIWKIFKSRVETETPNKREVVDPLKTNLLKQLSMLTTEELDSLLNELKKMKEDAK